MLTTSPIVALVSSRYKPMVARKASPSVRMRGTWQDVFRHYTGDRTDVADFQVKNDPIHQGVGVQGGLSSNDENWASITPSTMAQLESWRSSRLSKPTLKDVGALTFLIHEATHMRRSLPGWNHPDWATWPKGQEPLGSGFKTWDDEHQAQALAANLVPDAMQKFFGVKFDSKLGQVYWKLAKQAAATWGYGADPKNPLGPPSQNWQDVSRQGGDYGGYDKTLAPSAMPGW